MPLIFSRGPRAISKRLGSLDRQILTGDGAGAQACISQRRTGRPWLWLVHGASASLVFGDKTTRRPELPRAPALRQASSPRPTLRRGGPVATLGLAAWPVQALLDSSADGENK